MSESPLLAVAVALLLFPLVLATVLPPAAGGPVVPVATGQVSWAVHTVQPGETLAEISQRTGVPVEYLIASNDLDPSRLRSGQAILVPAGGVLHLVKPGQTLTDIAQSYGVAESDLRFVNGLSGDPSPGMRVLVPSPTVVPQVTAAALGRGAGFAWPVRGEISSGFGPRVHPIYRVSSFHAGIDIAVPEGTRVCAAAPGRVVTAGWEGGFGLLVVMDHGDGYTSCYGHLSQILVSVGQFVEIGQTIALSGSTGLSTGPHLHFEIRCEGVAVNPRGLLP